MNPSASWICRHSNHLLSQDSRGTQGLSFYDFSPVKEVEILSVCDLFVLSVGRSSNAWASELCRCRPGAKAIVVPFYRTVSNRYIRVCQFSYASRVNAFCYHFLVSTFSIISFIWKMYDPPLVIVKLCAGPVSSFEWRCRCAFRHLKAPSGCRLLPAAALYISEKDVSWFLISHD